MGNRLLGASMAFVFGLVFILGRKPISYNALMRNIFKSIYDEKRYRALEIISVAIGLLSIIIGILILIYG